MKILQLIQKKQLRGAEMFACQLSQNLVESGHSVKVVCLFGGDAKLPFENILSLGGNPNKRLFDKTALEKLASIISEFKPDIVQANAGDTLKYASLSKLIFGWKAPLVFRNANKMGDFIDSTPKKIFNQFLVNRCAGIASVSELCRQDFLNTFNFESSKTETLPIGTNLNYETYECPIDLKDVKDFSPILVNVASLVPEKNHLGLLEIFSAVKAKFPDAKLLIVGDGKLRGKLTEQINIMGLTDSVKLLGYRNDVLSILQMSDLFVLPSKIEGLPGVILEAFMQGIPVVVNDVGGISEVVKDKVTGRLIDPLDPSGFTKACVELLKNEDLGKEISSNAKKLVEQDFSNRIIADKFVTFYTRISKA